MKNRGIRWLGIFFVLVWGLPALACGGSAQATATPTKTSVPTFTLTAVVSVQTPINQQDTTPPTQTLAPLTETPIPPTAETASEPTATDTPVPTSTPMLPTVATANGLANLRAGPGTEYATIGSVQQGQPLDIVARTAPSDWYQLANGAWVAAFLVDNPPNVEIAAAIPPTPIPAAVIAPTTLPASAQPTAAQPSPVTSAPSIALLIVVNQGQSEVLGIRNDGNASVDIGNWRLDGSKGDDFCIMPGGTVLQPGEMFTIATGDSQPQGHGYKCGDKSIWNNSGETILLHSTSGQVFQIETR